MSGTIKQNMIYKSTMNKSTINPSDMQQNSCSQDTKNESPSLIFTERRVLPKLFDGLLTIIAWGGFIWLICLGLVSIWHAQQEVETSLFGLTLGTVSLYLLIAVLNCLLLILWAKYNQNRFRTERRLRSQELSDAQLTRHFGVTAEVLEQLKQSQIMMVQHNHDGTALNVNVKRYLGILALAANDNDVLNTELVSAQPK